MKIFLSPQRRDDTLTLIKSGAILTINGEDFDFSPMHDGDTLPLGAVLSGWFVGPVDKVAGDMHMTLILPLPANYSQEQAFPIPLADIQDGPITLPQPIHDPVLPEPEIEPETQGRIEGALE